MESVAVCLSQLFLLAIDFPAVELAILLDILLCRAKMHRLELSQQIIGIYGFILCLVEVVLKLPDQLVLPGVLHDNVLLLLLGGVIDHSFQYLFGRNVFEHRLDIVFATDTGVEGAVAIEPREVECIKHPLQLLLAGYQLVVQLTETFNFVL